MKKDLPLDSKIQALSQSDLFDYAYDAGFLAGVSAGKVGDYTEAYLAKVAERMKELVQ